MTVNADFRDLFSILRTCRVRYLVAGAHAVMYHSEPRYTKDPAALRQRPPRHRRRRRR